MASAAKGDIAWQTAELARHKEVERNPFGDIEEVEEELEENKFVMDNNLA